MVHRGALPTAVLTTVVPVRAWGVVDFVVDFGGLAAGLGLGVGVGVGALAWALIRVAAMAMPPCVSSPAGSSWRSSRISGSCSPISTNSSALSRNVRIVHIE